jgi:hypothetical protein
MAEVSASCKSVKSEAATSKISFALLSRMNSASKAHPSQLNSFPLSPATLGAACLDSAIFFPLLSLLLFSSAPDLPGELNLELT